ncbi:transposase [Parachlamydia sp.]|uniref:transposase n=1 Tax=Parachlamydia sp. TaxID=2052048 RepID=UPI003D130414
MRLEKKFPLIVAYYRGHWVWVPILHAPDNSKEDFLPHFKIKILKGKKKSPPAPKRCCQEALNRMATGAKETLLAHLLPLNEMKKFCVNNDIPVEWINDSYKKRTSKTSSAKKSNRTSKRNRKTLDENDYRKFIKELSRINKRDALIAKTLWFLNGKMSHANDFIAIEELLRLRLCDVDPDDGISACISIRRSGNTLGHEVTQELPLDLWEELCEEIESDQYYVFRNKNGGPLISHNLRKSFKKASKRAGLKNPVTSLSLRPSSKVSYKEISAEEWERLCPLVPELTSKVGRPSKHDPRVIFNAILYHLKTNTPLRKLPFKISSKAIHSQYRRWTSKNIFQKVLAHR